MNFEDPYTFSILALSYLLLLTALAGCIVPVLPGAFLVGFVVVGVKLLLPAAFGWPFVVVVCIFLGLVQMLDLLLSWAGAKKFGATWRGGLGAIIGSVLGIFMQPFFVWIFIMPFIMAFVFEWLGGSEFRNSMKAGFGAFMGTFLSMVLKVVFVSASIAAFTVAVFMKT